VTHLDLQRRGLVDLAALKRFLVFLRQHQVDIIHAHGTSLFFSALASCFNRRSRLLWHDHCGRYLTDQRRLWLYRPAARQAAGVIAVSEPLALWERTTLKVPAARVWFLPNFVMEKPPVARPPQLPGSPGKRIVCVANLRPEKDHPTLVDAMKIVGQADPSAVLILVGDTPNPAQTASIRERIQRHGLDDRVILYGSTSNVWPILGQCDIGVLASASEGMPLALLEYGTAGLPSVATRVGQVPEVLDDGRAGVLVPPGEPAALASALLQLLQSPELRLQLGDALKRRVQEHYSPQALIEKLLEIYACVLGLSSRHA
jgi:glycosyltransferase involved in cell wall biosynthesis